MGMGRFCQWVCACSVCKSGVLGGCKRASDVLELEAWVIVRHPVVAGNWSSGNISVLNHCAIASDEQFILVEI